MRPRSLIAIASLALAAAATLALAQSPAFEHRVYVPELVVTPTERFSFEVSRSSLDFGVHEWLASATAQTLSVFNSGNEPLAITALVSGEFDLVANGCTGALDVALPVTAELRYDVAYGTHRAGTSWDLLQNAPAPAGSTISFGAHTREMVPGSTSGSAERLVSVDIGGTHGQVGGSWSLSTTAAGFTLHESRGNSWHWSHFGSTCAWATGGGLTIPRCLPGTLAPRGQAARVVFTPPAVGVHTATLTFTPDAASGLPAQSWTLQGEGVFNLAYGTHRAGASTTPSSNPAAPTGFTVDFGALASGTASRYVMLDISGTHGQVGGAWEITGGVGAGFGLQGVRATEGNWAYVGACAAVAANSQTTPRCLGPAVTGQQVHLTFTPPATAGVYTATLTFRPDVESGLPPQSWTLRGESTVLSGFVFNWDSNQPTPGAAVADGSTATTAGARWGNSGLFGGAQRISMTGGQTGANVPGTRDFTLEAWVRPTAGSAQNIFSQGSFGGGKTWGLGRDPANGVLNFWVDAVAGCAAPAHPLLLDVWTHVAVVRQANTLTMFVDGTPAATCSANNADISGAYGGETVIGMWGTTGGPWVGLLDGVRLSFTARYMAAFTPDPAH